MTILQKSTQSSLLIPEKYLNDFLEKTKKISREDYFHSLLNQYKSIILWKTFQKSAQIKTLYQEEGQNLLKKNFRPSNTDWLEFGILANWLGISRTALFTLLLLLDIAGWGKILADRFFGDGVPPKITSMRVSNYVAKRKTIRANRHIRYKLRQ